MGQDSSGKISVHFIHFYPLNKPNFSSIWHAPPPPPGWLPFEHSGTKMSSLDIDPVYSTLCPRITAAPSTPTSHLNTFQYSVGGAVILNAITYSQECNLLLLEKKVPFIMKCLAEKVSCRQDNLTSHETLRPKLSTEFLLLCTRTG